MYILWQQKTGSKLQRRPTQGLASVEMALVAPIVIVLLFGIVELGLLINTAFSLKQAAREGARVGAVGAVTEEITQRIRDSCLRLNGDELEIELQYRSYSSGWGPWSTLGDSTGGAEVQNDAAPGSEVRAVVTCAHQFITGLFARQSVTVTVGAAMRRE